MPKQVFKLNQYHGGLNNNSDPRDIMENQLSISQNIVVDNLGKIRVMGETVTGHAADTSTPNVTVEPGYGLFAFNHDRTGGHLDQADLSGKHDGSDNASVLSDSGASYLADALIGATVNNTTDGSSASITDNTTTTITGSLSGGTGDEWDYDQSGDDGDAYTITDFPTTGANYLALAQTTSASEIYIYSKQAEGSGWGATAVLDLGSTADMKPSFYFANSALRVSDGSFSNSNKWWGYVNTTPKSLPAEEGTTEQNESNLSVNTWVYDDQALTAPVYTNTNPPEANRWFQGTSGASPDNAGSFTVNTIFYPKGHFGTDYDGDWDIPETGSNPSIYYIYTSYVYDNGQESALSRGRSTGIYDYNEGSNPWDNKVLWFDLRINNESQLVNQRIKGINFYWNNSKASPSERYLLAQYDLEKGLRVAGETERTLPWNTGYGSLRKTVFIRYKPVVLTFKILNGYNHDENVDAKFKTAVIASNRAYIGNVEQDGIPYPDAIFKSPSGKFDVFPESRKIEVVTADGDEIIKLEEYADRILQFKREKLQIINVSQIEEFLESTHDHKGVLIPGAVCRTDFGCAWVNRFGCYFYDGERVSNLHEPDGLRSISASEWASFTTDNSIIGYLPKKRQLIVLKDCTSTSGGDIFLYDFPTKSWVFGDSILYDSRDRTNFITDWNGDLLSMHNDLGTEFINDTENRDFSSSSDWGDSGTTANQWVEDSGTYNESASSGATEGTYFTDNYLKLVATSDASHTRQAILDGAQFESGMIVGRTYRLSYSIHISAYTSGTLSVGFANTSHAIDTDSDKTYIAVKSASTDYFDFVYDGTTDHAEIVLQASVSSAFTVFFDNFSLKEAPSVHKWSDTATSTKSIQLATKDLDFGFSSIKKKVYNVKVTYKGDASSLVVLYGIDGETDTANDLYQLNSTNTPLANKSATSDAEIWNVAELKPTTSSQANNIYSFRLVMAGSVGTTFEIKDISIIYRLKSIK